MTMAAAAPQPHGARAVAISFGDMPGWDNDDHAAAMAVFLRTCPEASTEASQRLASPPPPMLEAACKAATRITVGDKAAARRFFETWFTPFRVEPEEGAPLLTGYFEPELPASKVRSEAFPAPLYARPDDLVIFAATGAPPGLPEGLAGARRTPAGLVPYPDRGEIEDGALGAAATPVAWLRDPVDAFMVHVQGSTRLHFEDGTRMRVAYAGRNGHPYTSVGRLAVDAGHLTRDEATADRLYAWLKANPALAKDLMRRNRSFIFFREAKGLDPALGPVGGASVQLTPGRSLAIDRKIWSYGLPFWLDVDLRDVDGSAAVMRRLMVAQDTGTAIVGAARGDLFVGSGEAAGIMAGRVRHRPVLTVLWPRMPSSGISP